MDRFTLQAIALALFGGAATSHASYELMLVGDVTDREIDRYDPVTGTYLGSFGKGFLSSVTDVKVDSSTGRAYVADYSAGRIKTFDYSTGLYLGSFTASTGAYFVSQLSNGNLVASGYGNTVPTQYTTAGT